MGPCGNPVCLGHSLLYWTSLVQFTLGLSLLPLLHGEEHAGDTGLSLWAWSIPPEGLFRSYVLPPSLPSPNIRPQSISLLLVILWPVELAFLVPIFNWRMAFALEGTV